jgi:pimeloyl-ACP methyl ester carboxylesterase
METVASADSTTIAFDRLGEGETMILVPGAMVNRARSREICERFAENFEVLNYDRRGRGDSGDADTYAVEREIEDLAALIEAAGGSALVYAHSSGAALGLQAAAAGLPMTRLVAHEAPYRPANEAERAASREYAETLATLLGEGRRGDAVELFMSMTGMPAEMIVHARRDPSWAGMEDLAPTLAYDSEVMGSISHGTALPEGLLDQIAIPVLALYGSLTGERMKDNATQIAAGVEQGTVLCLEGQHHMVVPDVIVPVVTEYFRAGAAG